MRAASSPPPRPRARSWRIEPGGAEQILVVIEDRGRGVEREGQHVAGDVGIIAGDGGQIGGRRKILRLVAHQLEHRIDRAARGHHGGGGDLVDLHDRRLAARTKREDRGRHRLRIITLVGRDDPVFGLRGVEIGGEFFQMLAELPRHRMPPVDFGARLRRRHQTDGDDSGGKPQQVSHPSHDRIIPSGGFTTRLLIRRP
jgi:hypothetical protein